MQKVGDCPKQHWQQQQQLRQCAASLASNRRLPCRRAGRMRCTADDSHTPTLPAPPSWPGSTCWGAVRRGGGQPAEGSRGGADRAGQERLAHDWAGPHQPMASGLTQRSPTRVTFGLWLAWVQSSALSTPPTCRVPSTAIGGHCGPLSLGQLAPGWRFHGVTGGYLADGGPTTPAVPRPAQRRMALPPEPATTSAAAFNDGLH